MQIQGFNLSNQAALQLNRQNEAAEDFEAVFIQMSLKQMRPQSKEGFLSGGMAEDIFYQFFDEAISKEMAKSNDNLGLATALKQEYFEETQSKLEP